MIARAARLCLTIFTLLLALTFPACKHSGGRVLEVAYVSGVQVNLRDRVAVAYEKAGLVKNGDRVEVLDHDRHFVKVRTASGQMGWMEQRYLVSQQVFDQLQKLTADSASDPVQAQGVVRNDTNLHVEPGRETEHLYQILSGEKLAILRRRVVDRNASPGTAHVAASAQKAPTVGAGKTASETPARKTGPAPGPAGDAPRGDAPRGVAPRGVAPGGVAPGPRGPLAALEDWWLVRDSHGRVGWVLGRMIDIDVPLEVAQYAEGQRIVALFVLNEVEDRDKDKDEEKKVPQYLVVLTEPKDGLAFDFNQFRVFTWNARRHRYETAYREHIEGMLPVTVAEEDFGKEGVLPVFVVQALDEDGKTSARKYKLNTPIVRRVLAPGEEPKHAMPKRRGHAARRRR